MRKANNQNRFIRLITLPLRVLTKARNFYVRSMIDCADKSTYANAMGFGSGQLSSLPKSFSVNSSRSDNDDSDDMRELIRAASARSSSTRVEMDMYLHHQMRRRSMVAPAPAVGRSCSVGMGRIDEDRPCEFGPESFGGRAELVYPRSRSYAVTTRSVVF